MVLMTFHRITDLDCVYKCLTQSDVYDLITDDFAPPPEEFKVNDHPDIWYLGVNSKVDFVGLFTLIPDSEICWQVHAVMFCWSKKPDRRDSARELIPWLAQHTECKRLIAAVPAFNRLAIAFGTHGLGMHIVGKHEKAFMKYGKLHDLILMGRAIGG